ncbi:unnamed protein product, partial [Linum tenue]
NSFLTIKNKTIFIKKQLLKIKKKKKTDKPTTTSSGTISASLSSRRPAMEPTWEISASSRSSIIIRLLLITTNH